MKIAIVFFALLSQVFASSSHHGHDHAKSEEVTVYKGYVLQKAVEKEATAVYRCTCEDRDWKQDASKTKACPYCGPAMAQCGYLVKVVPARKTEYKMEDYDLPNKICPVSGEAIENHKHFVEVEGKKVYVCCKNCVKKFQKAIGKGKADRYMRKLPLKPEKFGFTKAEKAKKMKKEEHDHGDHDH